MDTTVRKNAAWLVKSLEDVTERSAYVMRAVWLAGGAPCVIRVNVVWKTMCLKALNDKYEKENYAGINESYAL